LSVIAHLSAKQRSNELQQLYARTVRITPYLLPGDAAQVVEIARTEPDVASSCRFIIFSASKNRALIKV
jgi:hypothetical protein